MIANKRAENSWGNGIIEQLAKDLKVAFPGLFGFSRTNLFSIRQFYLFYATEKIQQAVGQFTEELQQPEEFNDDFQFVRQAVAQIPWGHHVVILTKIKDPNEAVFYIQQTIEHNWSRTSLVLELVRHCLSFLKF